MSSWGSGVIWVWPYHKVQATCLAVTSLQPESRAWNRVPTSPSWPSPDWVETPLVTFSFLEQGCQLLVCIAFAGWVHVALRARDNYILTKHVNTYCIVKRSKPLNPQHDSHDPTVITTSSNKSEKDIQLGAVAWDGFKLEQPSSMGGMGPQLRPVLSSEVLRFERVGGWGLWWDALLCFGKPSGYLLQ